ncbi:hypothetical protein B566_EDAN003976 [Ephemera danica]|nr:hypothetical protein B566_EDAN003976 [Ephemera danica]
MNPNFQSLVRGAGPWHLENPTARQIQALSTIYMPDVTVHVQNENFKCHSCVLSFASPVLANMLRENEPQAHHPNQMELRQLRIQLNSMSPIHFRIILEIVYSGEVKETLSVYLALDVGHVANELQIFPVVLYCAARLR